MDNAIEESLLSQRKKPESKRPIESYEHRDKRRVNNPPVGLVTLDAAPDSSATKPYTCPLMNRRNA